MNKSVDLEKIKNKAAELGSAWKKKLGYLSESVSRSGVDGLQLWFKSHGQIDALQEALAELNQASQDENFQLLQVHTTLNSFVLPEEDIGQADWYQTAHQLLETFEQGLKTNQSTDLKLLQNVLKELKFISEADEFHVRYQLEAIQQKVRKLYQSLQQSLVEFKALEQQKLEQQQNAEQTKIAELETKKAEALAKKAMLENVKIKEKRLAIMEEKKRKLAEKEALDAERKFQEEQADIQAKQAEHERQAKLQDAYLDLQIEEKMSKWALSDLISRLREKIEHDSLDEDQKQVLTAFVDFTKHHIK